MTLEQVLKKAAYKVWDELEPINQKGKYKIFEVREEALTTMALKEIARSNCPSVDEMVMISGKDEFTKGYDFEIGIGSNKKGKYVRLFIQAKRLFGKNVTNSYKDIDFAQTDRLVKYAKSQESLAMYALYNHFLCNDSRLEDYYNSCTAFDRKSMGITLTSAYSISKLRSKKFAKYHYNFGRRIDPTIFSLRFFSHLFFFHQESHSHLAVPFHEIAYLTIELAEKINRLRRKIRSKANLKLLLLLLLSINDDEENVIPILKTNSNKLIEDFQKRNEAANDADYNPRALIIINTDLIVE